MRPLIIALACALAGCLSEAQLESDALPAPARKPVVVYASQIGGDEDFAADPRAPTPDDPEARAANFQANADAALAAAAAGQYGRYKPYATPDKAIECEQLLGAAEAAVGPAAAEMLNNSCGRDDKMVRATECPAVAALVGADTALASAGCPARPRYPTLRDK